MAVKIPCGGFAIDENSFEFDGDILKSKISGGDSGYEVTETPIIDNQSGNVASSYGYFSIELVDGAYAALEAGQECIVTVNEEDFTGEVVAYDGGVFVINLTNYSIEISSQDSATFGANEAGDYTVSCKLHAVEVSEDFTDAVRQVVKTNVVYAYFTYDNDADKYVCDMTFPDLYSYFNNNIPVIGVMEGYELPMINIDGFNNIAIFQSLYVLSGELSVHTVTYNRDGINDAFVSYDLSTLVVSDGG